MMKQLKEGLGFLKSLKLLYTILLIGFFGFGISSFVKAENIQINDFRYLINVESRTNPYNYTVSNTLSFLTDPGFHNFIYIPMADGNYSANVFSIGLFRYNQKLYFMANNTQGFYDKYCHASSTETLNVSCLGANQYGGTYDYINGGINYNNIETFYEYYNKDNFNGLYYLSRDGGGTWATDVSMFCINYTDGSWDCFNSLTGSLNFTMSPNGIVSMTDLENISGIEESPFVGGGDNSGNSDSFIPAYSSLKNVYNSLYQKGYRSQMCYGGFSIDDLLTSTSSSVSYIQVGSGATVFDLYNVYSGGDSFVDWYEDNYINFVYANEFSTGYVDSDFVGKSKGLIGLSIIRLAYWKNADYMFQPDSLQYFCRLYFDYGAILNTGGSLISDLEDSINQNVVNDIVKNITFLTPTSGSSLEFTIASLCESGNLTGSLCNPENDNNDSGDLWSSIDSAWNTWSLSGIREGVNGILPGYIIFGFFGILLLYYLRR